MTVSIHDVAQRLRPVLTRLYLLYFRQTASSSISMAQLSIMMNLADNGPLRISQIADLEAIRMPTASNAVNHLEQLGLVSRVRDVSDRRGVRVRLTEEGTTQLAAIGKERDAQIETLLAGLNQDELSTVEGALPLFDRILETFGPHVKGTGKETKSDEKKSDEN
ncbi:MAG: MarR family transcriptional regulator [Corynebacterium nuruki]|nr:MarR family transcriptional regulator [Corynebacterium nuruki]